jgi:hypothetical protein
MDNIEKDLKEIKEIIVKMLEIAPNSLILKSNEVEDYQSDNEEEDKWDNMEKACWSGYTQRGMKDKNGRMVPNCVPVEKAHDLENKEEVKKSAWSNMFDPNKFDKKIF